ncbi:MAG: bifunctional tetrahydrofolate synthase/dihydrofolate synthase [Pseudomonadales bacterium]|nr:bifunctional tetrahydrofolate synthase/dihydrofolate synthase [Pseudomonadales bacterium]
MPAVDLTEDRLDSWLQHIGSVHVSEIELGLERSRTVAQRLGILKPAATVITVAGTNGKGSVVACLEAALCSTGHKVGCYTSPHLDAFNERIRCDGEPMTDADIVGALAAVEAARADISLSYFEFATLAALTLFQREAVDYAVLEVGLGGRLDAVNIVDPHISVITRIDLDHQEWLGNDRETIALEKAGILREGVPFVCADPDPANSLLGRADDLQCPLYRVGRDFSLTLTAEQGCTGSFLAKGGNKLSIEVSTTPRLAPVNVASAVQCLLLLGVSQDLEGLLTSCAEALAPGRQEYRTDKATDRQLLFDVAHNPSAMALLANTLANLEQRGRLIVVLAVMADKDIQDMARSLDSHTDIWYIAQVDVPRCMPAKEAAEQIQKSGSQHPIKQFSSVELAYQAACAEATADDLIVVTGSFYTVAAVRSMSR